jgi:hypothetical protein
MRILALVKLSNSTTVHICSSTQDVSMTKLTMKTEIPIIGEPLGSIRFRDSSHEPPPVEVKGAIGALKGIGAGAQENKRLLTHY